MGIEQKINLNSIYKLKKNKSVNVMNDRVFNSWRLEKGKSNKKKEENDPNDIKSFKIELEETPEKEDKFLKLKKVK